MANWTFDPSQYSEKSFELIPVGDYRARIEDVVERSAANKNAFSSGNEGYEITMAINGYSSRMWFYLVLDHSNPARTNQSIGDFFNSFGITGTSMGTGKPSIYIKDSETGSPVGIKKCSVSVLLPPYETPVLH